MQRSFYYVTNIGIIHNMVQILIARRYVQKETVGYTKPKSHSLHLRGLNETKGRCEVCIRTLKIRLIYRSYRLSTF